MTSLTLLSWPAVTAIGSSRERAPSFQAEAR
jgi:hypothetical protein